MENQFDSLSIASSLALTVRYEPVLVGTYEIKVSWKVIFMDIIVS